jgi:hypothetical protein
MNKKWGKETGDKQVTCDGEKRGREIKEWNSNISDQEFIDFLGCAESWGTTKLKNCKRYDRTPTNTLKMTLRLNFEPPQPPILNNFFWNNLKIVPNLNWFFFHFFCLKTEIEKLKTAWEGGLNLTFFGPELALCTRAPVAGAGTTLHFDPSWVPSICQ